MREKKREEFHIEIKYATGYILIFQTKNKRTNLLGKA